MSFVAELFTSVAWFTVKPDRNQEFEEAFHNSGMLIRPKKIEGFIGAQLFRSTDDTNQYFVLGQWATKESYAQWQLVASHDAPRDAIAQLAETLENNRLGVLFEGPVQ